MAGAPGSVTVDVNLNHESLRQQVFDLLHRYSEWLDSDQQLIREETEDDKRSHEDLVREFLALEGEKN